MSRSVDRKYTVFISSTFKDLKEERQQIIASCLKMGHIPIGMEMFNAGNASQWEAIQRAIDNCDYYVVIVADRYGSTVAADGDISYTEKEYDYAIEKQVPVMGLVLAQDAKWEGSKRDTQPEVLARLQAFRSKVCAKMVEFWSDAGTLRAAFAEGFGELQKTNPRPGWIPSTQAASPETANEIARLSQENERLRRELSVVDSEVAEHAKLDKLRDEMANVGARAWKDKQTLWDLFVLVGRQFAGERRAGYVHLRPEPNYYEGLYDDLRALAALGALRTTASHGTTGSQDEYVLSDLGVKLLSRCEREQFLAGHRRTSPLTQ